MSNPKSHHWIVKHRSVRSVVVECSCGAAGAVPITDEEWAEIRTWTWPRLWLSPDRVMVLRDREHPGAGGKHVRAKA